uniref:Secreted protein n=1 Tax=Myotis myotis TaxID=51298 RepID=A0A7J7VYZ7_MYOMY|nr:hypothetical protein mMyoMyo1_012249 [Myotis myotis]
MTYLICLVFVCCLSPLWGCECSEDRNYICIAHHCITSGWLTLSTQQMFMKRTDKLLGVRRSSTINRSFSRWSPPPARPPSLLARVGLHFFHDGCLSFSTDRQVLWPNQFNKTHVGAYRSKETPSCHPGSDLLGQAYSERDVGKGW